MTQAANQLKPVENQSEYIEDEIELIDLLRVIWKWKYLILAGTLICALVAAAISSLMPKVYQTATILELDDIRILSNYSADENNETDMNVQPVYLDSPTSIRSMLELGVLSSDIIKYLKGSNNIDLQLLSDFNSAIHGDGHILEVNYQTPDAQVGIAVLNSIKPVLIKKYENRIKLLQSNYDQILLVKKQEIAALEDKIKILKTGIQNVSRRMDKLDSDIDFLQGLIKSMITLRDQFFIKDKSDNVSIVLLYGNTIQQNFELIKSYKNDLLRYDSENKNSQIELNRLKALVERQKKEVRKLENWKNNIQYIRVAKAADFNVQFVQKSRTKYTLIGAIVGGVLMIFLSFLLDYIFMAVKRQKNKSIIRNNLG